jgi:hypothetical protein
MSKMFYIVLCLYGPKLKKLRNNPGPSFKWTVMRWIEFLVTVMDNLDLNKRRGRFFQFFLLLVRTKVGLTVFMACN